MQSHLSGIVLNVREPEKLAEFYIKYLGMHLRKTETELRLSYNECEAYITLRPSSSQSHYKHGRDDHYWKIGITIPDVDFAFKQLKQMGVQVSPPHQFEDIGYLCHLTDPEGFQIELLQHTFENEKKSKQGDEQLPLGGGARLGQITLRTDNICSALEYYIGNRGMRLLSIQPVPKYEFDLYFLSSIKETPPHPALTSVENRPWLWQRPYTLLEIQHRYEKGASIQKTDNNSIGFEVLLFEPNI